MKVDAVQRERLRSIRPLIYWAATTFIQSKTGEANTETRQDAWIHEKVLSHTKIILFSAAISRLFPLHRKIFLHSKKWKRHNHLRTFFYFVAFKIKIGVRKCCKSSWQSSRQKTGRGSRRTLKSRVRCSPTEKETGFRQETKKDIVIVKDRKIGGLAVVSISDNNSNVIIGSLIKINLMSAIHNSFCLLKRSEPLWHLSWWEKREEVKVYKWAGAEKCSSPQWWSCFSVLFCRALI